ncbi:hypothetical protein HDR63_00665 [bacterium]|nr:hypothetical protein [bacterium]
MKRQIDSLLLGLLWALTLALGAGFWFNTKFGFNIFSGGHWRYLGQIQAAGTPVQPLFYISLVLVVVIGIGGLYLLIVPRRRRMRRAIAEKMAAERQGNSAPDASRIDLPAAVPPATPPQTTPAPPRPPRLNLGAVTTTPVSPAPAAPANAGPAPIPNPTPTAAGDFEDIRRIFTDAGYTIKDSPRMAGLRPAVFAIGGGENLWMGAVDTPASRMTAAVDRLNSVFTDTLDDIQIHIHAFIVGRADDHRDDDGILVFETVDALRDYMATHPAMVIATDAIEDFNAYGEYIDTVVNYLNKM